MRSKQAGPVRNRRPRGDPAARAAAERTPACGRPVAPLRLAGMSLKSLASIENWPVPPRPRVSYGPTARSWGPTAPSGGASRWPRSPSRSRPTRHWSPTRRAPSSWTSPRALRVHGPASARPHLGAGLRRAPGDRPARRPAPVLQRRFRAARRPHREGHGHPVRRVPAPGGAGAAGHDGDLAGGLPAKDGVSTVEDLLRFAAEVQAPRLLDPRTVAEAMTVQYPGTKGVLPGYGHQNPTTGASASRSATASPRTGPDPPPRRAPSGTSGSPVRSCGSTPTPLWPAWR